MSQLPTVPQDLMTQLALPSDDVFDSLASKSSFLPRIQLYGSSSSEVKRGEMAMGHYGLVRNSVITDLGKEVRCFNYTWQPLAMEIGKNGIVTCNNPKDPMFDQIVEKSKVNKTGFMWGYQYLLYLPDQKAFASFYMANASARREAPTMKSLMQKAIWLKNKLVEKGEYLWHAPVVTPCSDPFDLPSNEDVLKAVASFKGSAAAATEAAEPAVGGRAR